MTRPALAVAVFCLLSPLTTFSAPSGKSGGWPGKFSLPEFPKPAPERAFSELKIYDQQGSPLRFPKEDWAGARQRAESDPRWSAWVKTRQKQTDEWIAARRDHVEWVAGWWHDFVSPKDGSFLTFTPDEPGELTLSSPSDPQVKLTPKLHGAWVFVFRGKHFDAMVEAARLYRLTGDKHYAEWVTEQIDFYADNFERWPARPSSRVMWQSLDEAGMLTKLVTAARLIDEVVPAGTRAKWIDQLFRKQVELLESAFQFTHNIACWHRAAEAYVALYSGDASLWKLAIDGPNGLRAQVRRGITSDYLWFEQSVHYNEYVSSALRPFFEYAVIAGRGEELREEMLMVENLMLSPLYLRFPNSQVPNPADGSAPKKMPNRNFFAESAHLYPTAIGLTEAAKIRSWSELLDPLPPSPAEPALPEVKSWNLETTRMALIKAGPWQVFFHYGQLSGSHNQAEALSYEAFSRSTSITHDPGSVGYGSAMINDYYRAGLCHNVPLIDGEGQVLGSKPEAWDPGVLDAFSPSSVSASQPHYRPNARASRSLSISGEHLIDQVEVTTTDGKSHALGFVLTFDGKLQLGTEQASTNRSVSFPPIPGFKYWTVLGETRATDTSILRVKAGEENLTVTVRLPGDFRIVHASIPDYPPARQEAVYIETHGEHAVLTADYVSQQP